MVLKSPHRVSIAPMMDWTDRHFRYLCRLLTRKTTLYTEMIVDRTIMNQQDRFDFYLGHSMIEHPLVLQLGGNNPDHLREAVRLAETFNDGKGFSEYNLNVGCPSQKVSVKGCFGARLMLDAELVRDIMIAMIEEANGKPVTVKCRIGVDEFDSYDFVQDFISTVSTSGVTHFIIHARKCLLNGLSAHYNRTVPPLKYDIVHQLAHDFPHLRFSINGGIKTLDHAEELLARSHAHSQEPLLEGVMIGRAAYHNPWMLRHVDERVYNVPNPNFSRREIIEQYLDYAEELQARYGNYKGQGQYGITSSVLIKPLLALFHGEKGQKAYKRSIAESLAACKTPETRNIRTIVHQALANSISGSILDQKPNDDEPVILAEPEEEACARRN